MTTTTGYANCEHEIEHAAKHECERHELEAAVAAAGAALDPWLLRAELGELTTDEQAQYDAAGRKYDAARAALNLHDELPAHARC